jgi:hypothetical protein
MLGTKLGIGSRAGNQKTYPTFLRYARRLGEVYAMQDTSHFEKFADECLRLSQKQVYPRDRKVLLLMAQAWLLLSEHAFITELRHEQSPH